ncbi:MBL fold metallo-hydrolase [Chloroflexota bacterium]
MKSIRIISGLFVLLVITILIGGCAGQAPEAESTPPASQGGIMKIQWLGHASFLITSSAGVKIITDPYATSARLTYGEINESADIVTVSHEHGDHNNVAADGGQSPRGQRNRRGQRHQF